MGYYNESNTPADTAYVISAGSAGDVGFSTVDFWAADDCLYFICSENLQSRFLYYLLMTQREYLLSRVRRASVPRLDRTVLERLEIPLPPLPEQARITAILDRFDAITTDLQNGIPAEIAARRKQYGYYREKLLTFKPRPE